MYISAPALAGLKGSTEVVLLPAAATDDPPVAPRVGDEWGTIPPDDTNRSVVIVRAGVALLLNRLLKLY